jgi:hypothetical protein
MCHIKPIWVAFDLLDEFGDPTHSQSVPLQLAVDFA